MEQIGLLITFAVIAGIIAIAKSIKRADGQNKKSGKVVKSTLPEAVFEEDIKTTNKPKTVKNNKTYLDQKKDQLAEKKQQVKKETIKPTIENHLHGTTTYTNLENCKKPHYEYDNNKNEIDEEIELNEEDLKKAIIIGEIINNPAFKRRKR